MKFYISAMVDYYDEIEADTEEEAIDIFCDDCPWDVEGDTIYVEVLESEVE